jgi:hypothetical protein
MPFNGNATTVLGWAVGDALGVAVKFMPPGSFAPLTAIAEGGHTGLRQDRGRVAPRWRCVCRSA